MVKVELRLEVVVNGIVFECIYQLVLYLESALDLQQVGSKADNVIAAVYALHLVHRRIGIREEVIARNRVIGEKGIAEACGYAEVAVIDRETAPEDGFVLFNGLEYLIVAAVIADYYGVFISAHTRDVVVSARELRLGNGAEAICYLDEHLVSGLESHSIVDALEAVDINGNHGESIAALDELAEVLGAGDTVRYAGKLVGIADVAEVLDHFIAREL